MRPLHTLPSCHCELRALIVDDDPRVRALLRRIVERAGWQADEAADLAAARATLETHPPALVLLDQELPDGEGLELLQWWRLQEQEGGPTFVTITSLHSASFARRALQLGAFDCLSKPVSVYEMRRRLDLLAEDATMATCTSVRARSTRTTRSRQMTGTQARHLP